MSCKDCQNNVPDRTIDLGCRDDVLSTNTLEQIAVGPSSSINDLIQQGKISISKIDRPLDAVKYVSSAVKDISVRFGKVQPGLYYTEEDAKSLNEQVGVVFDDIEKGLTNIIDQMAEREKEINDYVTDQLKNSSLGKTIENISEPCEDIFDGFEFNSPVLDWENPIANSPTLKVGTCRLVTGCQFCDFPGDINIPPFPGIPSCNFTPVKSSLCGFEFFDPIATITNVVNGFQLFATEVGSFAYAFVDLANLATGFLGRCIIRILNCFTSYFTGQNLTTQANLLTSNIREQIAATSAYMNARAAQISTVLATIRNIVQSAVNELFRFLSEILNMCDPCKIVEAVSNPASLPQLPNFGF